MKPAIELMTNLKKGLFFGAFSCYPEDGDLFMTLTLQLFPEMEANCENRPLRGKDPEEFALDALQEKLGQPMISRQRYHPKSG